MNRKTSYINSLVKLEDYVRKEEKDYMRQRPLPHIPISNYVVAEMWAVRRSIKIIKKYLKGE